MMSVQSVVLAFALRWLAAFLTFHGLHNTPIANGAIQIDTRQPALIRIRLASERESFRPTTREIGKSRDFRPIAIGA